MHRIVNTKHSFSLLFKRVGTMMDMIQRDKERKLLGTFFGEVVVVNP